jgi:hypothetical protein
VVVLDANNGIFSLARTNIQCLASMGSMTLLRVHRQHHPGNGHLPRDENDTIAARAASSDQPDGPGRARILPLARSLVETAGRVRSLVQLPTLRVAASSNVGTYLLQPHLAAMEWWDGREGFAARIWAREPLVVIVGKASVRAWPEIRVGRSTCSDTPSCLPGSADGSVRRSRRARIASTRRQSVATQPASGIPLPSKNPGSVRIAPVPPRLRGPSLACVLQSRTNARFAAGMPAQNNDFEASFRAVAGATRSGGRSPAPNRPTDSLTASR